MQIRSNIGEVIEWMEGFKKRAPEVIRSALDPRLWVADAREVAEKVLKGLANAQEQRFIRDFVESVDVVGVVDGIRLQMEARQQRFDVAAAQRGYLNVAGLPLLMAAVGNDLTKLDELLLQWVREEKRKTAVDAGKTDEEIAAKLKNILLDQDRTVGRIEATEKLIPHLQAFFDSKFGGSGLDPETVDTWLGAVMAGWEQLVELRVGERIKDEG